MFNWFTSYRYFFMGFIFILAIGQTLLLYQINKINKKIYEVKLNQAEIFSGLGQLYFKIDNVKRHIEKQNFVIYEKKVTITTYNIERSQTDDSPTVTAFNTKARPGITCAVSDELIWDSPYLSPGDLIEVDGKFWVFNDTMNKRFANEPVIDLLIPKTEKPYKLVNKKVRIIKFLP